MQLHWQGLGGYHCPGLRASPRHRMHSVVRWMRTHVPPESDPETGPWRLLHVEVRLHVCCRRRKDHQDGGLHEHHHSDEDQPRYDVRLLCPTIYKQNKLENMFEINTHMYTKRSNEFITVYYCSNNPLRFDHDNRTAHHIHIFEVELQLLCSQDDSVCIMLRNQHVSCIV